MRSPSENRSVALLVVVVAIIAGAAAVGALGIGGSARAGSPRSRLRVHAIRLVVTPPPGTPALTIGGPLPQRIAPGFIGLSLEYFALPRYDGNDPNAVDPVFEQLVRNLTPGQRPVLRIGGDSSDHTWVPVPGLARPPGVTYSLSPSWLRTTGALARALDARVIPELDLESDSAPLVAAEARALIAAIGRPWVQALEIGNEPELYGTFAWYDSGGRGVPGRPPGYDVPAYIQDFSRMAGVLPRVPLAGPATGAANWMSQLGQIAAAEPRLALATVHRYPLHRCFTGPRSRYYPTIPHLLTTAASDGLAATVRGFVAAGHRYGVPVRIDELNSVSCSGKRGVSDTFASALWVLDAAFAMARAGVQGVNIHTFPGGIYEPFRFHFVGGSWLATVKPEYYGLLMFAQAAPAGARLLAIRGSPGPEVRRWATRAPDGTTRVVLINDSLHRARFVTLRIPGSSGPATLERLRAPSVAAKRGVTLGGQSFGSATRSGRLAGRPRIYAVPPTAGTYTVRLPAASAALLTLAPQRPR